MSRTQDTDSWWTKPNDSVSSSPDCWSSQTKTDVKPIFHTYFQSIKFTFGVHDSFLLYFHLITKNSTKKEVPIQSLAAGYLDVLRTTNILIFFSVVSPEANSVPACFAKCCELFCSESPERLLYNLNGCFSIAMGAGTYSLCYHVWVKYYSNKFYIFIKP